MSVNYFLGTTTNVTFPSTSYANLHAYPQAAPNMVKYRSSSSDDISSFITYALQGDFYPMQLNENGGRYQWNTNGNLVVGWYDGNSGSSSSGNYNYFYSHVPKAGVSNYRSIGFRSNSSAYVNPEGPNNTCENNNGSYSSIYLPDMQLQGYYGKCISCISPTTMAISNITIDAADLTWDEAVYDWAQSYEIKYGEYGFDVNNAGILISNISDTTYHLTGLAVSTTYDVYVRTNCEDSDNSTWAGPFTFTTNCQFTNLPYFDDFNSYAPHTSPICWIYGKTSDNFPMTTALSPYTYMFETEAGTYAYTTAPELNMTGVDIRDLQVSFDAKAYRVPGTITVGVMSIASDYSTFVPVETIHITDWAMWEHYTIPLGSYAGTGKYVAILSENINPKTARKQQPNKKYITISI